jgi:diaminopimelate decarboxylase
VRLCKHILSRIEAFLKWCEAFQKIRGFFKHLKINVSFFQYYEEF